MNIEINKKTLGYLILTIISCTLVVQIAILLKIIPYDITWGGQLTSDNQMYVFVSIAILINLLLVATVLMKTEIINSYFNDLTQRVILWIFFVIFVLNTIGNLAAKTNIEKCFSILTAALSVFIFMLLKKKK